MCKLTVMDSSGCEKSEHHADQQQMPARVELDLNRRFDLVEEAKPRMKQAAPIDEVHTLRLVLSNGCFLIVCWWHLVVGRHECNQMNLYSLNEIQLFALISLHIWWSKFGNMRNLHDLLIVCLQRSQRKRNHMGTHIRVMRQQDTYITHVNIRCCGKQRLEIRDVQSTPDEESPKYKQIYTCAFCNSRSREPVKL